MSIVVPVNVIWLVHLPNDVICSNNSRFAAVYSDVKVLTAIYHLSHIHWQPVEQNDPGKSLLFRTVVLEVSIFPRNHYTSFSVCRKSKPHLPVP